MIQGTAAMQWQLLPLGVLRLGSFQRFLPMFLSKLTRWKQNYSIIFLVFETVFDSNFRNIFRQKVFLLPMKPPWTTRDLILVRRRKEVPEKEERERIRSGLAWKGSRPELRNENRIRKIKLQLSGRIFPSPKSSFRVSRLFCVMPLVNNGHWVYRK